MAKSKGYQRFYDRLNFFRIDKEVVDNFYENKETLAGADKIFIGVNHVSYPLLNIRQNTTDSRNLVVKHLQHTVYVSFIKEIYEEVTEYIRYILKEAALNGADTNRLIGEHNVNMKANDILSKGSKKDIVEYIMNSVFQQLENERSTLELIKKIKSKLGLNITQNLIDDALPYLELRHVLVHSDGKPNTDFRTKYPFFSLDQKRKVKLTQTVLDDSYKKVNALLLKMDKEMIRLNYISDSEKIN